MTLVYILVLTIFALLAGWAAPRHWRGWLLLGGSIIAIYWLQPLTPIRNLDFWLPTLSIALTAFVWAVTQAGKLTTQQLVKQGSILTALVISAMILGIALMRYLGPLCCLTPTRPPELLKVLIALVILWLGVVVLTRLLPERRALASAAVLLIIGLFILLKSDQLSQLASKGLRSFSGQPASQASALDLQWLGFSYLAFRLLHVLRDYQSGKSMPSTLGEFVTYAIFFPSITAGPIDRSQHFIGELRKTTTPNQGKSRLSQADLVQGSQRILWGIFKKIVLADGLALVALSATNASQVKSSLWMWVLLYAYALRIYFDFSGYTDIAIGIGIFTGIKLPENFDRPYLKQNLTQFWNSWNMTLAQWFRAYYFNPVTRALRSRPQKLPAWFIILVGQLSTMLLIGLWHGITWNFAAWGAWHGLGLFIHNRWSEWIRPRLAPMETRPRLSLALQAGGWLVTFNYVALGWVWFALPNIGLALGVYRKLLGI
jgi:D-alanyl-lipoteichoic acid acyltransferase DltB (MBOAT superfamily)